MSHATLSVLAVLLAGFVALGGFVALLAIGACMRSSQISRWEERRPREPVLFEPVVTAPDPHVPPVIQPPAAWVHRDGCLPVPYNPRDDDPHRSLRKFS